MSGEESVQLRSVCVKIGSGATPRGGKEAYKGGATTLIRSQNVHNHGFYRDGLVRIDDTQSFELRSVEVMPDDVLLNITGDSVARCCQVVEDVLPARVNQHVAIVRPQPEVLDARYLRYVLVSNEYQLRLLGMASAGATRPALTKSMIEELEIPLPPLPEQRRIAKILGDLDDKIELNRKMNETLEQMARALFKSWFVDFDPVRAKMEGRQPTGMDAATSALFPDRLVDSELGMIPEGWVVKALGEVAVNTRRSINPSAFSIDTAYIGLEHIPKRSLALADWTSAESVASGKSQFRKGEILFGKLRPYFHKVGVAPIDGVCSTDILVIGPKSSEWFGFVLGHVSSDELVQFADQASTGTRMPRASWSDIESYQAVTPDSSLAVKFNEFLRPVINQVTSNIHQSRTLSTLRDTLLPKLVGGEVRVNM
jgi:type I restriction enzyme, S subunit